MKDGSEGFKANSRGSSFVIVDTVMLSEAFCYILDFVANNLPSVVVFTFTHKFPFNGWWPWGSLEQGTRMKTFKSCRLCNSLCPPVIQYSCLSELIACVLRGLSSGPTVGLSDPSVSADRTLSTEEKSLMDRWAEKRSCVLRTGMYLLWRQMCGQ